MPEPTTTGEAFEVTWNKRVQKVLSADDGTEVLGASRESGAGARAAAAGDSRAGGTTLSCKVLLY
ncbi:hypothetical protein [Streptomyces albidus (ex Kaewkla and Franco 2022)]|uniref:hypothetical protein n=1 Tax=Streptomyces albidus (ex Kaewkla and Franco 2022) TaxID=722709 RepID=UPI0015EFA3B1|nr:hypothetical protein [Streptomyces albidus (ex Kaewkla and Franco 2022)]